MKAKTLIRLTVLIVLILLIVLCLILIGENYLVSDVLKALIYLLIIGLSFFFGWLFISFFSSSSLRKAPGTRLLSLANFLYSPKSIEQVFHPLVADLRQEYFDELRKGNIWKARWLVFRYHYAFAVAAIYSMGRIKKSHSKRKEKVSIETRD